jgi:hypothetical protein
MHHTERFAIIWAVLLYGALRFAIIWAAVRFEERERRNADYLARADRLIAKADAKRKRKAARRLSGTETAQ